MLTKVFLAADHGGYDLKEKIKLFLILNSQSLKIEVIDMGTDSEESVDYPDYADLVCKKIRDFHLLNTDAAAFPPEMGVLVCGSGQGMAIRANKYSHIRAALTWNEQSTRLAREHNNANILCLGGRLLDHDAAIGLTELFFKTSFAGGRHQNRINKISQSTR